MPEINFKLNNLPEVSDLTTVVEQKFAAFEKYLRDGVAVTCDVEFEKIGHHQQGKIFKVDANVVVNGTLYRAEATEESFEKAVDEVRNELDKELRRAKEKQEKNEKRAGREVKRAIKGV